MYDTAIIGGGLAGLVTAARLARAGQRVVVLEGSRNLGGRARTTSVRGFHLNLGAHALYCRGEARAVLDDLGIEYTGKKPTLGGVGLYRGERFPLPITPWRWLTSGLLDARGRAELARRLIVIAGATPAKWTGRPLAALLDDIEDDRVAAFVAAAFRVATYCNDPARLDAGAALAQLQRALWNVLYLDGGWQSLIEGAARRAADHGVSIRTECPVKRVHGETVTLADGAVNARTMVLAVSPAAAAKLTDSTALQQLVRRAVPVRAAVLDVALDALPDPAATFALGLDRATYFSVHSEVAELARPGGAVVHALAYLRDGDDRDPRDELEQLFDTMQPGWRDQVVHERYLPRITVSHAMPTATDGGQAGRFGPEVPDRPGTYVVGDWVGPDGMLLDAALASAARVSDAIVSVREAA